MAANGFIPINDAPFEELYIATSTAIAKGELVKYTSGTGVEAASGTDLDDPSCGVAAEDHDGSTAGRESGTKIKVYTDPNTKFSCINRDAITATGGSTTTFVDSNLGFTTDDELIGGYLEVLTCAASSDMIGKMIPITDYTGSGGTITFAEQPAALASGDTAYLHPGKLAVGSYQFDLDSDNLNINYETTDGEGMVIVDAIPELKMIVVKIRLHQFGNSTLAI